MSKPFELSSEPFIDVLNIAQLMNDFSHPWCICGGWAIDLFVNQVSRSHKDIDIAIWRHDQQPIYTYLFAKEWSLEKAENGELFPWLSGEYLELSIHTIWCRNSRFQPDFIEIVLDEVNHDQFLFRRDLSITYPLENAIVYSALGLPILAPEIVLLYKARNTANSKNQADFEVALPHLNDDRRSWLKTALIKLYPQHHWIREL